MVYELKTPAKAAPLFSGWEETLITSCLQQVMGKLYVTDPNAPRAAMAVCGCFRFFAGEPDSELLLHLPEQFAIFTAKTPDWEQLLEACFPHAKKVTRYAIKKDTSFDKQKLECLAASLPEGFILQRIDGALYEQCLHHPVAEDFVSVFGSKEQFLQLGRGYVVLKDGEIAAGASSYSRYREGIEIEVDTAPEYRRRRLATAACAALILDCLEDGLYPGWDAQNPVSVRLAEKLGYVFDREYTAYEVYTENL